MSNLIFLIIKLFFFIFTRNISINFIKIIEKYETEILQKKLKLNLKKKLTIRKIVDKKNYIINTY